MDLKFPSGRYHGNFEKNGSSSSRRLNMLIDQEELPELDSLESIPTVQAKVKPRRIRKCVKSLPVEVEPKVISVPFKVETLQYPEIRAHLVCECIAQTLFMYQQIPMIWARLKDWADSEKDQIEESRREGLRIKPPKQCIKQLLKTTSTMDILFAAIHAIFRGDGSLVYERSDIVAVSLVFGQSLQLPLWTIVLKFGGGCVHGVDVHRTDLKQKSANAFRKKMVEESLRQQKANEKKIKTTSLHVIFCCSSNGHTQFDDRPPLSSSSSSSSHASLIPPNVSAELPLSRIPWRILQAVGEIDPIPSRKKQGRGGIKRASAAWPQSPWVVEIGI
jgi:hypothetical protein